MLKRSSNTDDGDFDDLVNAATGMSTSGQTPVQAGTPLSDDARLLDVNKPETEDAADTELSLGHIDDYLMRFMEWNMKDEPLVLPVDKSTKKSNKKGKEHRLRKRRR